LYSSSVNLRSISARAVIFDWDGTLLDSFRADARAYKSMFRALGVDFSDLELARHYSPDWYRVYRAARIPRIKWNLADRLWGIAYRKENPRLISGARTVLNKLSRSFALGLVTSGDRKRVTKQLRQFGFHGVFPVRVCSEDSSRRKPHPAPLLAAIRRMGMRTADCVYVGDTPEDIQMARRARVRSIGVLGPFPSSARLKAARPEMLLESIRDLPKVLRSPRDVS
jgi:HAD superfamily hydrolase (TIGR01509 family)